MKINMSAWKYKVRHTCLHALRVRGYRWPVDIAHTKVTKLLSIPEVDANDVTSMLSAFYESTYGSLDIIALAGSELSRQELALTVRAICKYYGFDRQPSRLLSITAMELITLTGIDRFTLPQMVRKIKHFMLGKPDPEELLQLPPISKEQTQEGCWWEDSQGEDLKPCERRQLAEERKAPFYGLEEYQPPEYTGGLLHVW